MPAGTGDLPLLPLNNVASEFSGRFPELLIRSFLGSLRIFAAEYAYTPVPSLGNLRIAGISILCLIAYMCKRL